jgi:hypothetical protein
VSLIHWQKARSTLSPGFWSPAMGMDGKGAFLLCEKCHRYIPLGPLMISKDGIVHVRCWNRDCGWLADGVLEGWIS